MGLYKLKTISNNIETGILEIVKTDNIDYEKDFENWLENSPVVLLKEYLSSNLKILQQLVMSRMRSSL